MKIYAMATARTLQANSIRPYDRVENLVKRKGLKRILEGYVSYMIPHRSDIESSLRVGGDSFTNGDLVVVGIPEWVWELSEEEILLSIRALAIHECQHVNSSNFRAYVNYQNKMKSKYSHLPQSFVQTAAMFVGNGTEDGRIEWIAANKRKGTAKPLKFFRGIWWKNQPVLGQSEFNDFLFAIVTYSTMGLMPKDWTTHYAGSRAEEQLIQIKPLINKAIRAREAKGNLQACEKIMEKIMPYLEELYDEQDKANQDFVDGITNFNPDFTSSSEIEKGEKGNTISIRYYEEADNEEQETEKGQDETSAQSGSPDSSGSEEKSSENMSSGNKQQPSDDKDSSSDEKQEASSSGSSGKSKEDDKEPEEDSNSSSSSSQSGDSSEESQDEKDNSGDSGGESEENGKGNDPSTETQETESKKKSEEELIEEEMEELGKELIEDAQNRLRQGMEQAKHEAAKNENPYQLNDEEIREIARKSGTGRRMIRIIERNKMLSKVKAPLDIQREGRRFRKEMQTILKNKESYKLRNQRRGIIDTASLWKVGTKDYDLFLKKGLPDKSDYAAFLLWDGSGSMNGLKFRESGKAIAVAEEGLKGIIPFKIMLFNSVNAYHSHQIVKEFNDNETSFNYTSTFARANRSGGGNRDGLAIRTATVELLKRPEKERMLIVFSDGAPSAYDQYESGIDDVQSAVKEARASGIFVISVYFSHSQDERDEYEKKFRYMYDKNLIMTDPADLTRHLIRTIKKVISR